MSYSEGINTLKKENFSDDEIIQSLKDLEPDLSEGIDTLFKEGFTTEEVLKNISNLNFEPDKEVEPDKLSDTESIFAGVTEAAVAPMALVDIATEKLLPQKPENMTLPRDIESQIAEKPIEQMSFAELYALTDDDIMAPAMISPSKEELEKASPEAKNLSASILQNIPKSETEEGRRLRTGTSAVLLGIPFGVPGMIGGLVGSQAGQTVREVFGEDGEVGFKGEVAALITDVLTGGFAAVGTDIARGSAQAGKVASKDPRVYQVFKEADKFLDKATVKQLVNGEKNALNDVMKRFSNEAIETFESEASDLSNVKFSDLTKSDSRMLDYITREALIENELNLISPINSTLEEGSRAIQDSTKKIFKESVIDAENKLYKVAKKEAIGLKGTGETALEKAKKLRSEMNSPNPTPDQLETIDFLDTFIRELETTTPERTIPASKIVDQYGNPAFGERVIPASTKPRAREANELIEMVQSGNHAINYDATSRLQSHRLKNVINALRDDLSNILTKKPSAKKALNEANMLHGKNAEQWGTKFMKKVRFSENPEDIVSSTKKASNLRNFKESVKNTDLSNFTEKMTIQNITKKGSYETNKIELKNLSPALSGRANKVSNNLIKMKDPLLEEGSRQAAKNSILKELTNSISTGKSPNETLELMRTPKGYNFISETLNSTPNGKEVLKSLERLFIEDIFEGSLNSIGEIDFKKSREILKNKDIRQVVEQIGGKKLINNFNILENAAKNLENNIAKFTEKGTDGIIKAASKDIAKSGTIGLVLHSLGVPYEALAALGIVKVGAKVTSTVGNKIINKIAMSQSASSALNRMTNAKTAEEFSKQMLIFSSELKKLEKE